MFRPIASTIQAVAVAVSVAAVSLGTAVVSHAEPTLSKSDIAFLDDLREVGITFQDPERMIDVALNMCQNLDDGVAYSDLVSETMSSVSGMRRDQAELLVSDSIWFYCPEFVTEII